MHELLLYGQVPAARHEQLLSILAGLTAMQPRRIVERRAIYRPIKTPSTNVIQRGGTQGVQTTPKQPQNQRVTDLNLLYLVKSVDEKEFGQLVDLTGSSEDAVESLTESERLWTFELQDTPEPGKRPVAMRYTHLTEIAEGDPNKFMQDLGYRYVSHSSLSNCLLRISGTSRNFWWKATDLSSTMSSYSFIAFCNTQTQTQSQIYEPLFLLSIH